MTIVVQLFRTRVVAQPNTGSRSLERPARGNALPDIGGLIHVDLEGWEVAAAGERAAAPAFCNRSGAARVEAGFIIICWFASVSSSANHLHGRRTFIRR